MLNIDHDISEDYLLWKGFLSGDIQAYSTIYEKYAKKLIVQGLLFTSDRELIKDCVHDIFVKLYRNHTSLKPVNNLKEYLFMALRNTVISAIMKQKTGFESIYDQDEYLQIADSGSIEDDFIINETMQINKDLIANILSKLTIRQREAVHYRFYENMSIDEISALMNMNYQSTQNLLQRALKKLNQILKKVQNK
ncbi:MAG: RNA polymerase sigma factor [Dysgonamonadaceae bacterium]|jgi:RNA polymerase sigma factor (sigma-70 family)|nr:RNA polymerase sigma factor [Dysgonamonadaceae bacterium]